MTRSRLAAETREIRRAIEALGRRGRTERVPLPIRERVVHVAEAGRAARQSWRQLAAAVGLAATTIERWWVLARRSRHALVPVQAEAAAPPAHWCAAGKPRAGGRAPEGRGAREFRLPSHRAGGKVRARRHQALVARIDMRAEPLQRARAQ